jgi:hypothetical protein
MTSARRALPAEPRYRHPGAHGCPIRSNSRAKVIHSPRRPAVLSAPAGRMASGRPPGTGWGLPTQPSGDAVRKSDNSALPESFGIGQGSSEVALMLVRVCHRLEGSLRDGAICLLFNSEGQFGLVHPVSRGGGRVPGPRLRGRAWRTSRERPSRLRANEPRKSTVPTPCRERGGLRRFALGGARVSLSLGLVRESCPQALLTWGFVGTCRYDGTGAAPRDRVGAAYATIWGRCSRKSGIWLAGGVLPGFRGIGRELPGNAARPLVEAGGGV